MLALFYLKKQCAPQFTAAVTEYQRLDNIIVNRNSFLAHSFSNWEDGKREGFCGTGTNSRGHKNN